MTEELDEHTSMEDVIRHLGQRALELKARMRTVKWATLPLGLMFVLVVTVDTIIHRHSDDVESLLIGLAMLPPLVALGWMVMAQERLRKAFKGLRYPSSPNLEDVRRIASPSAIGPLLEGSLAAATVISAWDHSAMDSATALLDALLKSVRLEDRVVLTADQHRCLQELVLPGRGDAFQGAGGVGGKRTVALQNLCDRLCPTALRALGLLGDASAIPVLERFARPPRDSALQQIAVRSAAQIRERIVKTNCIAAP
jgi:hypothetical protein